jgi:precorrin-2/cobalt-factor-2 C20-methyltransferase
MIIGRLIGVGVGPGDPELITVKAIKAIRATPVIAYISANGRPSMARQIVAEHLASSTREIKLTLPMDPMPELAQSAYDEGASRIGAELEQGRNVAALCEGDPMFYGSFGHLFARLAQDYPVEVIPGISSVMTAAAEAARPLAFGKDSFAVLPATMSEELLTTRLGAVDGAAILKLGRHLEKVRAILTKLDLIDKAVYVEHASTSEQQIMPLADLDRLDAPYFSLILVSRYRR